MSPIFRLLGLCICLFWSYGIIILISDAIQLKEKAIGVAWIIPLGIYLLLLLFPYVIFNRYPKWVRKVIPRWLINSMVADYFKNFNKKVKDLPDE